MKAKTIKTLTLVSLVALCGCIHDGRLDLGYDTPPPSPEQRAATSALILQYMGMQANQPHGVVNTYDPIGVGMIGRAPPQIYGCSIYGCL